MINYGRLLADSIYDAVTIQYLQPGVQIDVLDNGDITAVQSMYDHIWPPGPVWRKSERYRKSTPMPAWNKTRS